MATVVTVPPDIARETASGTPGPGRTPEAPSISPGPA